MSKVLIFILFLLGVLSCSTISENRINPTYLTGFWKQGTNHILVFDSIMLHPTEIEGYYKYQIENDTITIFDKSIISRISNGSDTVNTKFKIIVLDKEQLVFANRVDTLTFSKIIPKQSISKFKKLYFSTEECDGTCPVFELLIESNGSISYFGDRYTEIKGQYSSVVDSSFITSLNQLLEIVDIKNYPFPETHPPPGSGSLNLKIEFFDGDSINIRRGSFSGDYDLIVKALYLFETLVIMK